MSSPLRIGLIGAGRTGERRVEQLGEYGRLLAVYDRDLSCAEALGDRFRARICKSADELIADPQIDAILVSTFNDTLAGYAQAALQSGKHVLVEKPAARSAIEFTPVVRQAAVSQRVLAVGYNHRFHPALQEARRRLMAGEIGPLLYIRARYGHGGRIGYEQEWRADPKISGGGELIDQGVHLIDLCRWIGGALELEHASLHSFYWKMPVEDNAVLTLRGRDIPFRAFLHASCTEWKNLFDFEIFGQTGKLQIIGLGRSYGTEELRIYKMKPQLGPPDLESIPYPMEDRSWEAEWKAFAQAIRGEPSEIARGEDALSVLDLTSRAYSLNE